MSSFTSIWSEKTNASRLVTPPEIDYSRGAMTYASAHRLSVAPMMDWTDLVIESIS